jgi:hypothetical protein
MITYYYVMASPRRNVAVASTQLLRLCYTSNRIALRRPCSCSHPPKGLCRENIAQACTTHLFCKPSDRRREMCSNAMGGSKAWCWVEEIATYITCYSKKGPSPFHIKKVKLEKVSNSNTCITQSQIGASPSSLLSNLCLRAR